MTGRLAVEERGVEPPDGPVSLRTGGSRRPSGRLSFFRLQGLGVLRASTFGGLDVRAKRHGGSAYNENARRKNQMRAVQISGQWYVVRDEPSSKRGFVVLDGPYAEEFWAVSAARLNEI